MEALYELLGNTVWKIKYAVKSAYACVPLVVYLMAYALLGALIGWALHG